MGVAIDPLWNEGGSRRQANEDLSLLTASYLYHFVLQAGGVPVLTRTQAMKTNPSTQATLVLDTGCSICISIDYNHSEFDERTTVTQGSDILAELMRSAMATDGSSWVTSPCALGAAIESTAGTGLVASCLVRFNSEGIPHQRTEVLRRCLENATRLHDGLVAYHHHRAIPTQRPLTRSSVTQPDTIGPVPDIPTGPAADRWARMGRSIWPSGRLPAERLEWFCRMWTQLSISNRSLIYFDVQPQVRDGQVVLVGSANTLRPATGLEHALRAVGLEVAKQNIRALPDRTKLGRQLFGICRIGSALTMDRPSPRGGMQSQLLLGEPVFLLDQDNGHLLIQGGDGYWGWVSDEAIERMEGRQFDAYRRHGTEKVPAESMTVDDTAQLRADRRVQAALDALYTPYIFGGRSAWGTDCSGLVTTVWAQAGTSTARDAWQQALAGSLVATAWHRSSLRAGDQLFFINDQGKLHHTGIAINATHLIHASPPFVQISSLQKGDRLYDARLDRDFFVAKRP